MKVPLGTPINHCHIDGCPELIVPAEDSSDLQGGIASCQWSRRTVVTTATPTVTHDNGNLIQVMIDTSFSLLGYTNGNVTIDDLVGNVQTRFWSLRPSSWSPSSKRMSVTSSVVSWSVLDSVAGMACQ